MTYWSKEQTINFIERYRDHECLWHVNSKTYRNKYQRDRAYDKLTSYVKTFDPQANRDSVLKRIHNLRSSFNKELKKVNESGSDEVHTPKLWYYDLISFIKDPNYPTKLPAIPSSPSQGSADNTEETIKNTLDEDIKEDIDEASISDTPSPSPTEDSQSIDESDLLWNTASSTAYVNNRKPNRVDRLCSGSWGRKKKRTLKMAFDCEPQSSSLEDDRFDTFGRTVAQSLRQMSGVQWLHAQKLISEITYAGELGLLSTDSYFVSESNQSSSHR